MPGPAQTIGSNRMLIQIFVYAFTLWLGLYLLNRDWSSGRMRLAGLGLVVYSLALGADLLAVQTSAPLGDSYARIHWALLVLPPVFWAGAEIHLLPADAAGRGLLHRIWMVIMLPVALLTALLLLVSDVLWSGQGQSLGPAGMGLFVTIHLLPLVVLLAVVRHAVRLHPRRGIGLILLAGLFFVLGAAIIVLRLDWLPHSWAVLAIGLDLELLGLTIAYFDTFDQGEALLPDMARSLAVACLVSILFGGQVAFAMAISTGVTPAMILLLLAILAAAIALQVFSDPIQSALDGLIFAQQPGLRQGRDELRAAARAMPRLMPALDPQQMPAQDFERLTRKALSHFGDLPKLAASPLTRLELVETRLSDSGRNGSTLERASELKRLLTESILRLKPAGKEKFGTSDEWRFYNSLYFPYVVGLRPYSRRAEHDDLDPDERQALTWFQTAVPPRTLYNWQNAAAEMVARDLLEQIAG